MPAPGDQHRPTPATANPFLDHKQHVTEYSAAEIATLQSRLDKQLGPEYVSTRPGQGGGKVHYLAAEKAINLANEVFGFNGWSSSIQNVQIDFVDEHPQTGKISLGLSTIVRVTIRDGTFHEDIGYGHIENCKGKAAAFEKAKKEAATDAMKRALRNFGNVLGNCLYDKDYLQKVQKIKVQPSRWDADRNLHRHPDFVPIKGEAVQQDGKGGGARQTSVQSAGSFGSAEFEDDFGGNMLDETDFDHPETASMEDTAIEMPAKRAITDGQGQQRQGVPRVQSMPQMRPPNIQSPTPLLAPLVPQRLQGPPRPPNSAVNAQPTARMPPPPQVYNPQRPGHVPPAPQPPPPPPYPVSNGARPDASSATLTTDSPTATAGQGDHSAEGTAPRLPPPGIPDGFVSGRSAEYLNAPPGQRPSDALQVFNPHAEATSIRRTHGVNPGRSAPITRSSIQQRQDQQQIPPAPVVQQSAAQQQRPQSPAPGGAGGGLNGATTPIRTNFVNPSADLNRRIGMPPGGAMQNRGPYRPPTAINAAAPTGGVKRAPLTDVSNLQAQQMDGAADTKKAKLDRPEVEQPEAMVQPDGVTNEDATVGIVAAQ